MQEHRLRKRIKTGRLRHQIGILSWVVLIVTYLFIGATTPQNEVDNPNKFSFPPEIKFHSIEPNPAWAQLDEIKLIVSYRDEDGDLCVTEDGADNLFVKDLRNNKIYPFKIVEFNDKNIGRKLIPVSGEIAVHLFDIDMQKPGNLVEKVQFEIYAIDRMGQKSNIIITEPIELKRFTDN